MVVDPWPKIRLLLRAEILRVRVASRVAAARAWYFTVAVMLALGATAMFALAGFVWLEQHFGPVAAALITGGALGAAALIAVIAGHRVKPGPEAALAVEVETLAREGLQADMAEIRRRVETVERTLTHPFGGGEGLAAQLSMILSIVNAVLSHIRREREPEEPDG